MRVNIRLEKDAPDFAFQIARDVEDAFSRAAEVPETVKVKQLPNPALPARIIFVSDESGGFVPAFNDGVNWRRITDRAVVS